METNLRIVIFALFAVAATCVHLRHQAKAYDSELYLKELQTRQDKLKGDLQAVRKMYEQMDKEILAAAKDPKLQLSLLQEGLADERDSLFSIQQYLNLPLSERKCQCFNFGEDLKQQLRASIDKVSASIAGIEALTQECADCAMVLEIKNEVKQQKNYLSIMRDTLESKCCTVFSYAYLENLDATNWMYGGQTPEEYKAAVALLKAQLEKKSDTLVKVCPLASPFPDRDFATCQSCPDNSLIYNLKTRACEQCPIGKIFNYATRTCDFNIACPAGTKFN